MSLFGGLEKLLGGAAHAGAKDLGALGRLIGIGQPTQHQTPPAAPQQLNTGTLNAAIGQLLSPNGDQEIGPHPYPNILKGLRFNNGPTIGVSPHIPPGPLINVLLNRVPHYGIGFEDTPNGPMISVPNNQFDKGTKFHNVPLNTPSPGYQGDYQVNPGPLQRNWAFQNPVNASPAYIKPQPPPGFNT